MEVESATNTVYIKSSGLKKSKDKTDYYYCSRSGYFKSKGSGIRAMKSQGTSKIYSYCTSKMILHQLKNDSLEADIVTTHYGHDISLGHLRIAKQERQAIAGMIIQGVSFDSILDKVRDDIGPKLHPLVKKDLHNIERAYNIRTWKRHSSDSVSVNLWVKEMGKKEGNPVLFYKQQGQILAGLDINDFALVIQTPLQTEVLQNCGSNKVVCLDATHGTNGYDFKLISVLVVDEFGEGFPVAWCFSNREDKTLLVNFLKHLKQRSGNITPEWLMSDDAEQFYSAWIDTFDGNPRKVYVIGMLIDHGVGLLLL